MGYTTDFWGRFELSEEPSKEVKAILRGLNETRRMARSVDEKYGVEGEFWFEDKSDFGQAENPNIIDYNRPPSTQPGLWCQWALNEVEGKWYIEWDRGEKFYYYVEWLKYIINRVLDKTLLLLNGEVTWKGEESDDLGRIIVKNNKVTVQYGHVVYE